MKTLTVGLTHNLNKHVLMESFGESDLKNNRNISYVGQVSIGNGQKIDVVFDTGSDWLVVEAKSCTDCLSTKRFD